MQRQAGLQIFTTLVCGERWALVFFVLSGALLSYPFWISFINGTSHPTIKNYSIARVARIVPATWLNLILCTLIALYLYEIPVNFNMLIAGLLFINSYHYSTFFLPNLTVHFGQSAWKFLAMSSFPSFCIQSSKRQGLS